MSDLRSKLIRLAHQNPALRADLLPLLKEAGCEKLPEGGMRDNCEKKVEEGEKADKADKKAGLKIVPDEIIKMVADLQAKLADTRVEVDRMVTYSNFAKKLVHEAEAQMRDILKAVAP